MRAIDVTVQDFVGGLKKAFIIPPYQRNYAWGAKQCREIFKDILNCAESGSSHYIGNVVYYLGENSGGSYQEIILVDGQQRITTILLILCAIRDITNDNDLKCDIEEQYLCNKRSDDSYRIRLKQTVADADSFAAIIDGVEAQDTESNIVKNYHYFRKEIPKCIYTCKTIFDAVARMQLVDVNLQVAQDSKYGLRTVQTIFEKINSTGLLLSQADLIRNFLLITQSDKKQKKWHNDYWLNIEKNLGVNNISVFARDFLRMKNCEEIREADIYIEFKEYLLNEMDGDQEAVLKMLLHFSKFYAMLINLECPDEELARELTMLRNLRSNDFAPLVLYLLERLYSGSLIELRKIIHLIVDYLLRMRIASPTTGSGTTRSLSFELIQKLQSEGTDVIECTYDALLFELSNSPTIAGEFPSDDIFIASLQKPFYHIYARELLLRVEESETKNIPVDISKVTVEHLMPQTLSDWWKQNLGGNENAESIRLAYMGTIGNYAIVSQGYNSSLSNKPWHEKRNKLKDVQFKVTSSVANIDQWDEKAIIKRGEDMSKRAAIAITSPLPRTREYRSRMFNESITGLYPLVQNDYNLTGKYIQAVIYNGERKDCPTWSRLLCIVGDFLYSENPILFAEAVSDNVWFSREKTALRIPMQIPDSPWFCGAGGHNGIQFRNIAAKLTEKMECQEYFQLEIVNPVEAE